MFTQLWNSCEDDEYTKISQDVRKLQNDLLSRRVRRPFVSGVTSDGINYIDTRPTNDNNNNTITSHHSFTPTPNDTLSHFTPLPEHHKDTHSDKMGVTIVLSHGFSQGLGMWSENIDEISEFYNVNRVVAFDWRGMGGSERKFDELPLRSPMGFFEQYSYHDVKTADKQHECKITQKIRAKLGLDPNCDPNNTPNGQTPPRANSNTNILPHIPSDLFINSIRTILSPLTIYSSEETKNSLNNNIIKPTASIISSLYQTLDHTLSFDKYVQSSIDNSYTPQKSVDYFIDPLIPMFKELQLDDQPVILIAHSLGGLLSSHFCKKYPGLVHGMVLVSPAGVSEGMGLSRDSSSSEPNTNMFGVGAGTQVDVVETVLNSAAALGKSFEDREHQDQIDYHDPKSSLTITTTTTDEDNNTIVTTTTKIPPSEQKSGDNDDNDVKSGFNPTSALEKQHPKIVSGFLYDIMGSLWKLNLLQPQTILRLLPNSAAKWICNGMAIRMHNEDVMGEEDRKVLAHYLELLLTAPPVGEYAMNSILTVDYPKKEFSKDIGKDLHRIDSNASLEQKNEQNEQNYVQNEEEYYKNSPDNHFDSDDKFMQFIHHTYDYKRQVKLHQYLKHQRELEAKEIQKLKKDGIFDQNDPNLNKVKRNIKKNGDSNYWQPRQEEIDNPRSDIRTPSVFARSPLGLSKILPQINIPIEFVYGDDDWLYQGDVPFIVRNLSNFYKNMKQNISDWVVGRGDDGDDGDKNNNPLPKGLYHQSSHFNNDTNTQLQLSDDVSNPYSDSHSIIPTIDTDYERQRALTMLNVMPTVSLDIVSNAGHHLYGNNAPQFHTKVKHFVENVAIKPFEEKVKGLKKNHNFDDKNNGKYDPSYTKGLLQKYWYGYQQKVQIDKDKKERAQSSWDYQNLKCRNHNQNNQSQPNINFGSSRPDHQSDYIDNYQHQLHHLLVEPINTALVTITSPESVNTLVQGHREVVHGIVDSVFNSLITPTPHGGQTINQDNGHYAEKSNNSQLQNNNQQQYSSYDNAPSQPYHVYSFNGDLARQQRYQQPQQDQYRRENR